MEKGDLVRLTRPGGFRWLDLGLDFGARLGIVVGKGGYTTVWWLNEDRRLADDIAMYQPCHGWKVEVVSGKR